MRKTILILNIFILLIGCKSSKLPLEELSQFEVPSPQLNLVNNNLEIYLVNPLKCPLRAWIESPNDQLQTKLNHLNPIELKENSDTLIKVLNVQDVARFSYPYRLGSAFKEIEAIKVELPFPKNKAYRIIQGNNTNHTHSTVFSKYALDINLKVNDTICAATSGFVVGVIEKYKYGGEGDKWRPFGNFITIYEPMAGIFTQYAHLVQNGSLVEVGDVVKSGQAIGLSGKTGQTDIEHLHFNCLIPASNEEGLKSIPFEFSEGYRSEDLKKNDIVKNKN